MDVVGGEWVRWFLDLTCDFWAKNEKNNFWTEKDVYFETVMAGVEGKRQMIATA
jgi:hypothetical protein